MVVALLYAHKKRENSEEYYSHWQHGSLKRIIRLEKSLLSFIYQQTVNYVYMFVLSHILLDFPSEWLCLHGYNVL